MYCEVIAKGVDAGRKVRDSYCTGIGDACIADVVNTVV
jgi:hypothetical protein